MHSQRWYCHPDDRYGVGPICGVRILVARLVRGHFATEGLLINQRRPSPSPAARCVHQQAVHHPDPARKSCEPSERIICGIQLSVQICRSAKECDAPPNLFDPAAFLFVEPSNIQEAIEFHGPAFEDSAGTVVSGNKRDRSFHRVECRLTFVQATKFKFCALTQEKRTAPCGSCARSVRRSKKRTRSGQASSWCANRQT